MKRKQTSDGEKSKKRAGGWERTIWERKGVGRQPEREERWSRRGRGSEEEGEDFPAALLLTEVSAQPSHNQKRRYLTHTTVR